eukprot:5668967-Ditylum_brightwellii.AAC.1
MYNNRISCGEWTQVKAKGEKDDKPKSLVLMAEIQAIKSTISQGPGRRNNPPNLNSNNGRKELPAWRFQNPNNK